MSQSVELLGQGAGYGILVGVGALFAGGMILTTKLLQKYLNENAHSTETFSVANRSVGVRNSVIFTVELVPEICIFFLCTRGSTGLRNLLCNFLRDPC